MKNLHGVFSGFVLTRLSQTSHQSSCPVIVISHCRAHVLVLWTCWHWEVAKCGPACYNKEEKGWKNPGAKGEVKARLPPAAPVQPRCSDQLRPWDQRCGLCRVAVPGHLSLLRLLLHLPWALPAELPFALWVWILFLDVSKEHASVFELLIIMLCNLQRDPPEVSPTQVEQRINLLWSLKHERIKLKQVQKINWI